MSDFFDATQTKLTIGKLELVGFTRGAFKTGLILFPYKICLDAGFVHPFEAQMYLISHGHLDHIAELYPNLAANTPGKIPKIITTPGLLPMIRDYLNANASMSVGKSTQYKKYEGHGLTVKQLFTIEDQNMTVEIEPFQMVHSVESIGFGVSEMREKLKPEFVGKTPSELIEIKKTYKINHQVPVPMFLFCGDTGCEVLPTLPFSKFPLVIIESTFLGPDDKPFAIEKQHLHISDLEPYFLANPATTFVLIHFSNRYKLEEIQEYQKIYEEKYKNIEFFVGVGKRNARLVVEDIDSELKKARKEAKEAKKAEKDAKKAEKHNNIGE